MQRHDASFRDPSGYVFTEGDLVLRAITRDGAAAYDELKSSGLYEALTERKLMVAHEERAVPDDRADLHAILLPEQIPFISYPYEWCFGQLRAAALHTLEVQKTAMRHGMVLRDASAYNVQFIGSRPSFIDTSSFGLYEEGQPWVAYRQFCQHFLAPLALMSRVDIRLGHLLRAHLDGIPLDLASRLLPTGTWLRFGLVTHLHMHARSQARYADASAEPALLKGSMSRTALIGLIDSLVATVSSLSWSPAGTEWEAYYDHTNYSDRSTQQKLELVSALLKEVKPQPLKVWDLGANTGRYSRLARDLGAGVVAFDVDVGAVERNFRQARDEGDERLLPLVQDLTNPSGGLGWGNRERTGLVERGPADAVLALALIHHLAIANNVPLAHIAAYLSRVSPWLILEFVPKSDSQVRRLLATREDIFPDYHEEGLEQAFAGHYEVARRVPIADSDRVLYLMRRIGVDREDAPLRSPS